jgi:hypothetical protein
VPHGPRYGDDADVVFLPEALREILRLIGRITEVVPLTFKYSGVFADTKPNQPARESG